MRFSKLVVFAALILALVVLVAPTAVALSAAPATTVTTNVVTRVRSGPGTNYPQISLLPAQATVPVRGRDSAISWVYVEYSTGSLGWVAAWLVTPNGNIDSVPVVQPGTTGSAPNSPGITTATTVAAVNLRPQPNTSQPPITVIPGGATIEIYGRNAAASWLSVAYQGKQGWVSAKFVALSAGAIAGLPVVGAPPSAPTAAPPSAPATPYTGHISNVGPHLDAIYQRGQQLGNNPHVFTKVGDCEMEFRWFLQDFDAGVYDLGSYQYLQEVIGYFSGSFAHLGQVANAGMSSSAIFQAFWSDPAICQPGETPLACEYRTRKPAVALIMLRTIDRNSVAGGQFYSEVSQATQFSIDRGVIPVLQTMPYWGPNNPDTDAINNVIRRVAAEKNVPLWDYYLTSEQLPNRGVTADYHIDRPADGNGTTFFTQDKMQIAATRRNLEALEVLHAVLTQVIK